MRDELTFSDSDNEHIPDSPILFITNQNNKQVKQKNKTENRIQTKHILKSNEVRVEFTSNADDNEDYADYQCPSPSYRQVPDRDAAGLHPVLPNRG